MAVLIDTSVLVASERGSTTLGRLIQPGETYAISAISAAELLHGVHRATGRRAQARSAFVEGILNAFAPLPVDMPAARAYAHASAALAKSGATVDANDLWIGATAIAAGMEVLAIDGDFERIPGLRRASLPQGVD